MSSSDSDFQRPNGVSNGILLNTNNEALKTYKRRKKKMMSIDRLENEVAELKSLVQQLLERTHDNNNHTSSNEY